MAIEEKPSRNEEEYFALRDAEVAMMREFHEARGGLLSSRLHLGR